MKTLFETNVFRDAYHGDISEAEVEAARSKVAGQGHFSPISLVELGSRINDAERGNFPIFQGAVTRMLQLCDCALPDPEYFLRTHVFEHPGESDDRLTPTEAMRIAQLIAQAKDYEHLVGGQIGVWNDTYGLIRYNSGFLSQFRKATEEAYLDSLREHVIRATIPDHATQTARGKLPKIVDPEEKNRFSTFLHSGEFRSQFYRMQAARCFVLLLGSLDSPWDQTRKEMISPFFEAYRELLRRVALKGTKLEKHKNDFFDLHFLIYLADPEIVLVTRDGRLQNLVPAENKQRSRIISFKDWLATGSS